MQQKAPHWRLVLGKMFLGVALAINNLLGGALGGQIIRLPEVDGHQVAGAPPEDPSRSDDDSQTVEHTRK